MECPICGEQVPLNAEECPLCGNPVDRFFLTEEVESSMARQMMVELPYAPRGKFVLPALSRKAIATMTVTGLGFLVAVVLLLVFFAGGKSARGGPDSAIRGYYRAIEEGDLRSMVSRFTPEHQPRLAQRSEIERALEKNTYAFDGLLTRVLSNDGRKARLVLEAVEVTIVEPKRKVTISLVNDVVKPLQEADPDKLLIVDMVKQGGSWRIDNDPMNGWAPQNIWVVGVPGTP